MNKINCIFFLKIYQQEWSSPISSGDSFRQFPHFIDAYTSKSHPQYLQLADAHLLVRFTSPNEHTSSVHTLRSKSSPPYIQFANTNLWVRFTSSMHTFRQYTNVGLFTSRVHTLRQVDTQWMKMPVIKLRSRLHFRKVYINLKMARQCYFDSANGIV